MAATVFATVIMLVIALPALYWFIGMTSVGKDSVTEQRIRRGFRQEDPNPAIESLEKLVGPIDPLTYVRFLQLPPKEREDLAVAIWEQRRATRVYE